MNCRPLCTYMASPYSDPSWSVRTKRYYYAVAGLAELYRREPTEYHFSPIVHSHPLVEYLPELEAVAWLELDMKILPCCRKLVVLKIDGWSESRGVAREIVEADKLGIPIGELTL